MAGRCFESLEYRDTYRDAQRLGDKKSLLFSIALRSPDGTLTSQQADEVRDRIVAACQGEARSGTKGVTGAGLAQMEIVGGDSACRLP